jgi:subtilisin family serine protease
MLFLLGVHTVSDVWAFNHYDLFFTDRRVIFAVVRCPADSLEAQAFPKKSEVLDKLAVIRYERLYAPHEWVGGGDPMSWYADDASWQYILPFDFPFYGVNYRTIYISSNGLITFLGPDTSYSNSIEGLADKLAIAPAWDDWVTEEPYDIFIWENSTQVGIRWYVRTFGGSTVANFEAILKVNGDIQFNHEFNDGPVSATIGISNGAGDILAEDATSLSYTDSIIFKPIIPEHELYVTLESPRIAKLGSTVLLNATVINAGLNNETNVNLNLMINGTTVYSETILNLPAEESFTLNYSWTPTIEGVHNITAYAPPVVGEEYVENNFVTQFTQVFAGYLPNDPMYFLQWHLRRIECPKAWEITKGNPQVVVAVIDTGVDYDHPDLYANTWQNNYEVPFNGIDDDGNGYVDDWIGWDFADEDNDPMDCHGHGTHCAGIVAAMMDNNEGGTGIAPNIKIMPVKIFRQAPCAVATTVKKNVTDADNTLSLLRKFRDNFLLAKYVKLYYEFSRDIVGILLEEPLMLAEAARLIEKYTPAVRYIVEGKGEDVVMATDNVNEIISFMERLKGEVNKRTYKIGVEKSSDLIKLLNDFEVQVRASKGKTFSQAFQDSIYFGRSIKTSMTQVETTDAWIIKGIKYAADNGAHIISMSFGGYESEGGPKPDIEDACEYAYMKGCLLVASAGNDARREVCYPAKYNTVIAVSAIDYNYMFSRFQDANGDGDYLDDGEATNYGPEIELCAPGGGDINGDGDPNDENEYVYSTVWDNTYGGPGWVGTSMSTPHVCGVAALIKSLHPEWTNEQIRVVLLLAATDLGTPGRDEVYGYGTVNTYAAVTSSLPEHDLAVYLIAPRLLRVGGSINISAHITNYGLSNETNVELRLLINNTIVDSVVIPELMTGQSYTLNFSWTPTVEGIYNVTAYAPPVSGENITTNNFATKIVKVMYAIFYDDFDAGLVQWNNFGSPTPATFWNPVFWDGWGYSTEGDSWYASGSWSKQLIDISNGVIVEFRVKQEAGNVWDMFYIIGFGGIQSGYREDYWPYYFGIGIMGHNPDGSAGGTDDIQYKTAIAEYIEDAANDHQFHIYKMIYDGLTCNVEFYKDDNFIGILNAGPRPYDELPLLISGRDYSNTNYLDWIRVLPLQKPEHDLAVTLDAPSFLELGESGLINATVWNRGLSNETNVEFSLLINGTVARYILIPELLSGESYALTFSWTPTVAGMYNVTAYATPVPDENITANNLKTAFIHVLILPEILIVNDDDGAGQVSGTSLKEFELALKSVGYDYWVWNESSQGRPSLNFLKKFKLVIWTCGDFWNWAVDPSDAVTLQSYLAQGGKILLEGEDIGYDHDADEFMVNVAHAIMQVDGTGALGLTVTNPTHPVTFNLPTSFTWLIDPPYDDGVTPTNGGVEVIRYAGTTWTAVTVFGENVGGKVVYYAFPLYCLPEPHRTTLAINSINWLLGISNYYTLTITATAGGTTNPTPRTYTYTAGSIVQVTAIPDTGYLFDYWELDSVNVGSANPYTLLMDKNHTLKAVFSAIPPLTVSINPLSASILVGQSVTFTSTASGGYQPYTYQWFLNGNPVSGATSANWTFKPTTSGIFYVNLKVTDAKGNTAQSESARVAVATVPVGGYSIPIQAPTKTEPILPYMALVATLTIVLTKIKNKTKRKR